MKRIGRIGRMVCMGGMVTITSLAAARPTSGSPILLTGLSDSGLTAAIDNYTLVGNVFAFDLTNTSPGFIVTNFGEATAGHTAVQLPFVLQTNVPTSVVPTSRYLLVQPPGINPAFPTVPTNDWGLFITQFIAGPTLDVLGLPANQTFHFAFTLSDTGGFTALQLANGLVVRLRDDSDGPAVSTDLVATFPHTSTVPEPGTLSLIFAGLVSTSLWKSRNRTRTNLCRRMHGEEL